MSNKRVSICLIRMAAENPGIKRILRARSFTLLVLFKILKTLKILIIDLFRDKNHLDLFVVVLLACQVVHRPLRVLQIQKLQKNAPDFSFSSSLIKIQ